MSHADRNGNTWLKLAEAKAGDEVLLDHDFTCHEGGRALLYANKESRLYFRCAEDAHFIDGQADDGIHCIGIYP